MSAHPMQPRGQQTMPIPRSCEWVEASARLAKQLGVSTGDMWAALLLTRTQVIPDPWRDPAGSAGR